MTVVVDNTIKSGAAATVSKPASSPPLMPVAVSVNGKTVSPAAITREIQNHPAARPADAWQAAARALVIRELLLQEAGRLGVGAETMTDEDGRRETDEEALIRALVEQEIVTPEPDEASCRRYYDQNQNRFRSADIYEASHILFAAREDDPVSFGEAQIQAKAALAELASHPERFGELAATCSACPSAAQGGNLGQLTAGQTTPEFERALFALEPGSVCESPVPTRYGVHIIRLDRKVAGRQVPFELVAEKIADYLRDSVHHRATAQYIARLVSRATIVGVSLEGAEAHRVN
jgi:peptidyl-prolyl cis-trans isomerase C